jgi:hypothetical protein
MTGGQLNVPELLCGLDEQLEILRTRRGHLAATKASL